MVKAVSQRHLGALTIIVNTVVTGPFSVQPYTRQGAHWLGDLRGPVSP